MPLGGVLRNRLELLLFLAIALVGIAPALAQPLAMVGDGVDAFGTWWFFDWIRVCIEDGVDPSFTTSFFWPHGKDNFAHTGNNFVDAVLSVPLQWLLGARYQPVWIVAVLLGNALTFRPLARLLLEDEERTFAATLLWLCNPYVIFEITAGRPTQAFLWFVPVVPYFLIRVAREGQWRHVACLGASCALVAWTYWYQAIFTAVLLVPVTLSELRRSGERRATAVRWGAALALAALLVAPAAIPMSRLWAAGGTPGGVPTKQSVFALPGAIGNSVGAELQGLALMEQFGARLFTNWAWGIPLAVALAVHLWRARRPIAGVPVIGWAWWVGGAAAFWLGIGPGLRWGQDLAVNVPYMVLYRHLPFFNRLWFPYRFASVCMVVAVLAIAAAMPPRRARWLALALALVGLGEQARNAVFPFNWHDVRCPKLLEAAGKEGGALIFLPFRIQHDGLIWQTVFKVPTFGGMGESAPVLWPPQFKRQLSTPAAQALRMASTGTAAMPKLAPGAFVPLTDLGFRWVALRRDLIYIEAQHLDSIPQPAEAVRRVAALLGDPVATDGGVVLWDLKGGWTPPPEFASSPERLSDVGWTPGSPPSWSTTLSAQGREGRPTGAESGIR